MLDQDWRRYRLINILQSFLLVSAMGVLLGALGWIVGGAGLGLLAVVVVVVLFIFNPALAPRLVVAMYRGSHVPVERAPHLYDVATVLARRAGLNHTPDLYYIPSEIMNAFALGSRNSSAIAISDGLLRRLNLRELSAVIAHEMTHVASNDVRVMGFADLTSRVTSVLSIIGQVLLLLNLPLIMLGVFPLNWVAIMLLILAPSISGILQLALSRSREYHADLGAARLTGDPGAMISALSKMDRVQGRFLEQFLLPQQLPKEPLILRTHPRIDERIRRLLALRRPTAAAQTQSLEDLVGPARYMALNPAQPPRSQG